MATKNISATIEEDLAEKLNDLAQKTHRKKSYYINQALREYLEAIEDYEIALSRKDGEAVPLEIAKKELDL